MQDYSRSFDAQNLMSPLDVTTTCAQPIFAHSASQCARLHHQRYSKACRTVSPIITFKLNHVL